MAVAGYSCTLKGTGTPTAVTDEACTEISGGAYTRYQITSATKRIVDVSAAVVVKKNTVAVDPSLWTLNPVFGIVTFDSALLITDAITVSWTYLPQLTLASVTGFSVECTRTLAPATVMGDEAVARSALLQDAGGSLDSLEQSTFDYDPGGGTQKLDTILAGGTIFVLEVYMGAGSGQTFRAIAMLESRKDVAAIDDLMRVAHTWKATKPTEATAGLRVNRLFALDSWT